ncbi:MAG TPA: diaminopimelate epimerase [Actinomycetota bacterium]|nr:diaminopimelate epimerase [Actinomycetota bacterium]
MATARLEFAKYQGIGNDFVMLSDPHDELKLTADLAAQLCDRRFGIGADGVIRVAPGRDGAELFMDYLNSDGSTGEMCGNGIRCLALFARHEGLSSSQRMMVGTRAGDKIVEISGEHVRVDMGAPIFEPGLIPVRWDGADALQMKLEMDTDIVTDDVIELACLSMGNPHAVLFTSNVEAVPVRSLGPLLERHPAFPQGTNVLFVDPSSSTKIRMRVWERGSGETLACGTGACAAVVASRLLAGAPEKTTVVLPGGRLHIEWEGSVERERPVFMTGPAQRSFAGAVELESIA